MDAMELALERLHRNGVLGPFPSAESCARNLAGIQSQLPQFAELAIAARCSRKPSTASLERLYRAHRLIGLWGQRKTLHVYAAADWGMICDVYHARTYASRERRKTSPEFFAAFAEKLLAETANGTPIARKRLAELLAENAPGALSESGLFTYLALNHLCANGLLFGIPAKPSIREFALFTALDGARWRAETERTDASTRELLRRYFCFYGPATVQDFSHWSGLPVSAFRDAFHEIKPLLTAEELDGRVYYSLGDVAVKKTRRLSLLGKFDPLFVSYRHKDWIVPPAQQKRIWRSAGHVEAVILDGVRLLGTWRHILQGNKMAVRVEPLAHISAEAKERVYARAHALARFWGKELSDVAYE